MRKLTACVTYHSDLRDFSFCAWVDVIMPTLLTLQIVDGFLRSFLRRIATEECFPADAPANEIVQMRLPFLNHRATILATLLAILSAASMALPRASAQETRLPKRNAHI